VERYALRVSLCVGNLSAGFGPSTHTFAYQDNAIVIGPTLEQQKENLREVLWRLRKANLRLNPEK